MLVVEPLRFDVREGWRGQESPTGHESIQSAVMSITRWSLAGGVLFVTAALMAAQAPVAELRVIAPGVVYNAGLLDLAASFEKETRTKVTVTSVGMGRIVNEITTVAQPPDVIMLPFELMSTLSLDGGVKPGTFTPLGR